MRKKKFRVIKMLDIMVKNWYNMSHLHADKQSVQIPPLQK